MLRKLLARFRRAPVQTSLLCSVLLVHGVFLLILLISPEFSLRKKVHKQLIVKTIIPPSRTTVATVQKNTIRSAPAQPQPLQKKPEAKKQVQSPPTPVVKKPAPTLKKEPAIADKVVKPAKGPPPAKSPPPPPPRAKISDALLQELEESIAKIETNSDKKVTNKTTPVSGKVIAPITLQIDATETSHEESEGDYTETLVDCLHQQLKLPEYGEVKIQLSLRQDGTVAKVIVLNTQSEKNRQYLESTLLRLKFPRFEGTYANKKESTFVLTFCNEGLK